MNISNLKVIRELGHGMIGTVYLVKDKNNKKYALKIEHILSTDANKNMKNSTWREIDFSERCGNKYPEFFMKLYTYDIINQCTHKQKYSRKLDNFPPDFVQSIEKLSESPYCARKIYSLVDNSLDDIVDTLNLKQCYSMLLQIMYALHIMHKHGYVHCDLHGGNVGVIKTSKKYITCLDHKIPTFGYRFIPIDYGLVKHKKIFTK